MCSGRGWRIDNLGMYTHNISYCLQVAKGFEGNF